MKIVLNINYHRMEIENYFIGDIEKDIVQTVYYHDIFYLNSMQIIYKDVISKKRENCLKDTNKSISK